MLNDRALIIGAGIAAGALVALVVANGGFKGAGRSVGGAAVTVADGVVQGVVEGTGTLIGIPLTDEARGRAAAARGDWFEASKYLPAAMFLRWVATGSVD